MESLDISAINQLVADLTNTKPEMVQELSKLVYSKTYGNCFYTLHTLRNIHEKNLMYIAKSTRRWEWDSESIREHIQVSNNVTDFTMRKLQKLPQPTLDALVLSSFLGTKVEIDLLESMHHLMNPAPDAPPLQNLLESAEAVNLIEIEPNQRAFKFMHDRVTAAAYNMIPEGTARQSLHLKIGFFLYSLVRSFNNDVETEAKQSQLILAVDQLNRATDLFDRREQRLVAKLNLIAAQQVLKTGAFKLATEFLETGIELVGVVRWEMCYDLTIQMSVTLASVHYSNGSMEESLELVNEIFAEACCAEDKYEAQFIQLEVLASMGKADECLKVGLATLKELGHPKLARKPHVGHIVLGVFGTQKTLRRMSDEDILSLPHCTNRRQEVIMRHLNFLSSVAFFANQEPMMIVLAYRVMQITLRFGLSRFSPYAFCSHATTMAVLGNFDACTRFSELSLRLMGNFHTDVRTSALVYGLLYHLKRPIHEPINESLSVYHSSFSRGDLRSAGLACLFHCLSRYAAGLPLEFIAKDISGFYIQLQKYQTSYTLKYLLILQRVVLELIGRPEEISKLVDKPHNDIEFESRMEREDDKNGIFIFWIRTMEARFYLGYVDSALEFGERNWRIKGPSGVLVFNAANLLFSALTALEAWKKRRKRRHWRMFHKWHNELATWGKKGNLNTRHLVLLLDAELLVVRKQRPDKIRSVFESSISSASRSGFVHDAALASERAGQYFLRQNDMYWAEHYLLNAHELYRDWNAAAKVRQMEETYDCLTDPQHESGRISFDGPPSAPQRQNVSLTGRSRLDVVAQVEAQRKSSRYLEHANSGKKARAL